MIRVCLNPAAVKTKICGAYAVLKHWYRHTSVWVPNPYRSDTEKVMGAEPHPPGIPLETHVDPLQVNNDTPLEAEVEAVVCCMHLFKSGGHTHRRAEH